jgi:Cu-processing system permease protein
MTAQPLSLRSLHREPLVDVRSILTIAAKELRDSLRNRWFILYTAAFTILALGLSYMSLAGTGRYGFGGFGRTAAGLINLTMLIVPLMALTAGAGSIAGERDRGTLGYLLSQPVSRLEVIAGKYLGLALALLASLALGFGVSAAVIAWRSGSADAQHYVRLVGAAYLLSLAMLSTGFVVSVIARRGGIALAASVFLWLAFVFVGDLGLMVGTLAFRLQAPQLFSLALLNPLQVFRLAAMTGIHASLDVLGPAGLYATQTLGYRLDGVLAAAMLAWIVLPLAAAMLIFSRRGAA